MSMSKVNVLIGLDSDLYAAISNLRSYTGGSKLDEETIINYLLALGLEQALEQAEITE